MDHLGHVLIRSDLNVPIDQSVILDDYRIKKASQLIPLIKEKTNSITFISHLGRPVDHDKAFSLRQLVDSLSQYTSSHVNFINDVQGDEVAEAILNTKEFQIYLLENLRYYDGEVQNDESFAKNVTAPFDTYIFDAFGASHREHASVVKFGDYLDSFQGPLVKEELLELNAISNSDQDGLSVILGGAKISDKIQLIKHLITKVESLLIGGAMCFTFLKAMGHDVGDSLYEEDYLDECIGIIHDENFEKIQLPIDFGVTDNMESSHRFDVSYDNIGPTQIGVDIGMATVRRFQKTILKSKTIFWNGPMGVFEKDEFSKGTSEITGIVASSKAYTVIGGGDTVSAVRKFGNIEDINYVSTGGGASLEYLGGKQLPGINKYPSLII